MATREELYAKFGVTAEAAQLLETDLGTIVLVVEGWKNGWHVRAEPERATEFYERLNRKTLGQLLREVKLHIQFDDAIAEKLEIGLAARNRLNHGFYERHNFAIQTDDGRDKMIEDLESLHTQLFEAWQTSVKLVAIFGSLLKDDPKS
jgi:hypothetical protein